LAKVFFPSLFTQEQWTYLDVFIPMILPVLDINNNFERIQTNYSSNHQARIFLPYLRTNYNSLKSNLTLNYTASSKNNKRSIQFMPTSTFILKTANVFEEYYDFTTNTVQDLSTFNVIPTTITNSNNKKRWNLFNHEFTKI
jgi:hypothetical protein